MSDKLIIFDTTLRDGEQSPGASMTREEKIRIARQLERLKVDVIEAGFAASSNGDFEAIRSIAQVVKDSTICSLARANDKDIARAAEALKPANSFRIHTFIATSALHMEKKLRMTPDQVYEQARLAVRFARQFTDDIEFSPEDGSRSDMDFLCRVLEGVIAEGATTINLPDTVGYAVPEGYAELIRSVRERIPNSDKAVWSVHCHNDLGMAVANSLAAVKLGGARQIECTINGLGERAGNTSLEEVVMAVKTRRDYFDMDVGIDTTQIVPASKLVSQITGFVVQPNKAVVGANAFAHASGIHQDGVLKARDTYEIMRAEDGLDGQQDRAWQARAAMRSSSVCRSLASNSKAKRRSTPHLLASRSSPTRRPRSSTKTSWRSSPMKSKSTPMSTIASSRCRSVRNGRAPHARVVFNIDGSEQTGEAEGNGPVDATLHAIEGKVNSGAELVLYSVNAITAGTQAQGEVTVRLSKAGRIVNGVGTDPISSPHRPRPTWPR
jgi:2-isopropylmalate synthase